MSDAWDRLKAWSAARRPLLRVIPERRLAVVVAVLAPLWLLSGRIGESITLAALAALAVCVVADWLLLPTRGSVGVERELPASIGLGETTRGVYVARSRWPRGVRVRLYDELPRGVTGGAPPSEIALPAREVARVAFDVKAVERGRFPLGRVALRIRTPIGLLAARDVVVPEDEVLVTPSIAGVRRFRLLAIQNRLHTAGVRALRQRGDGRAFAGLREYALGDDPRHIDWKATARRQKLITREYSIEQSQTVLTLIDAGRSMTQLAGEFSRFEHALSAALVLTDVAANAGDRVGTLVFDHEVRAFAAAQRGRAALRAARDALTPVTATMTEPDYAAAFRFLAARQRRRALVVFFTDVIDVRASRALLAHVARSAARHLVIVVALRNDALVSAAIPSAPRERALYLGAAAEELLLARAAALEQMRRAGVTVLDVSPRAMTAAVVNRYLEIKSRGAL